MDLVGKKIWHVKEADIYDCLHVWGRCKLKSTCTVLKCGFMRGLLGLGGGMCSLSAPIVRIWCMWKSIRNCLQTYEWSRSGLLFYCMKVQFYCCGNVSDLEVTELAQISFSSCQQTCDVVLSPKFILLLNIWLKIGCHFLLHSSVTFTES